MNSVDYDMNLKLKELNLEFEKIKIDLHHKISKNPLMLKLKLRFTESYDMFKFNEP